MKNIFIPLAITFSATSALAHPGKTDAKGGHTDSKTGRYHIHKKPDAKADAPKKDAPKKKK